MKLPFILIKLCLKWDMTLSNVTHFLIADSLSVLTIVCTV